MVDIGWVVVNAICAILQAVYELFRPPPMKPVRLETALVSELYYLLLRVVTNKLHDHFLLNISSGQRRMSVM